MRRAWGSAAVEIRVASVRCRKSPRPHSSKREVAGSRCGGSVATVNAVGNMDVPCRRAGTRSGHGNVIVHSNSLYGCRRVGQVGSDGR